MGFLRPSPGAERGVLGRSWPPRGTPEGGGPPLALLARWRGRQNFRSRPSPRCEVYGHNRKNVLLYLTVLPTPAECGWEKLENSMKKNERRVCGVMHDRNPAKMRVRLYAELLVAFEPYVALDILTLASSGLHSNVFKDHKSRKFP